MPGKRVRAPYQRYQKKKKSKKAVTRTYVSAPSRAFGGVLPAKLIYHTSMSLNPGIASAATHVFRLASIFDPDLTGVGHQPGLHDQLSPIFERYQVWKVDFKVIFKNNDSTNTQRIGYSVSDDSTTTTSFEEYMENGNSDFALLSSGGSDDLYTMSGSILIPEVHGVSYKQYMSNDDYGANFGSNPVEDAYVKFIADGIGTDTGSVSAVVTLVYHVKMMGSKVTAQS